MALSGLVDEGRQVFEEVEIMSQMVAGTGCIGREGRGGPVGNWWALLPFAPVGMARFPFFSFLVARLRCWARHARERQFASGMNGEKRVNREWRVILCAPSFVVISLIADHCLLSGAFVLWE